MATQVIFPRPHGQGAMTGAALKPGAAGRRGTVLQVRYLLV